MTDDAVEHPDPADPAAAGAGGQRGGLDELRASARGWQGIQLAVLGFIGLCGVLQRGDSGIPHWIQVLAGIAALVALGLACVATYLVGRAAFPLYGGRRGDVTEDLAGTKRRLIRGLTLTFVAVALTALAATSSWWPVSSDGASSGLVELSTSQATVCGQLSDNAGTGIGLVIGGRTISVPIDAVTAIHAVDECP
jgi:type IV secretory pathway VirB2 component (pilin)